MILIYFYHCIPSAYETAWQLGCHKKLLTKEKERKVDYISRHWEPHEWLAFCLSHIWPLGNYPGGKVDPTMALDSMRPQAMLTAPEI